jgi:hypothetical protein
MGALALGDGGGCLGLEMPDGFRKNVYFGFSDFMNRINALCGNRVDFCIPTRKRGFQQNQALDPETCLLSSTFVYLSQGRRVVLFGINGLTATGA